MNFLHHMKSTHTLKFAWLNVLVLLFTNLVPQSYAEEACEHPFIDLNGHWAEDDVCFLYSEGVVEGTSTRNYSPDSEISRAEFLKIALLNVGYSVYSVPNMTFTDLIPGEWYYPYISFAKSQGFVSGYLDGSFHPNSPITRAEGVVMIMNISEIGTYDASSAATGFYDVNWDDWFAEAVAIAIEKEIIVGYGDESFRPHSSLSRGEAASMAVQTWEALY